MFRMACVIGMSLNLSRILLAISLISIFMLAELTAPGVADAAITQPGAWTNAYSGTSNTTTYSYTPGGTVGTNRIVAVAIHTAYSANATATPSTITYNGVTMTLARGDNTTSQRQHTMVYYLPEANLPTGAANLVVTVPATSIQRMFVNIGTFAGVDQTTPIDSTQNSNRNADGTTAVFAANFTINANCQGIMLTNVYNHVDAAAITIGTDPPAGFAAASATYGDATTNAKQFRLNNYATIPGTTTNTTASHGTLTPGTDGFSMTGVSIRMASVPATTVGTATATAASSTSINVSAPYSNDTNGDNRATIKWNYAGQGFATPLGTYTFPGHAASPYQYVITGLTPGTSYDVEVTYSDGDGVAGTNPQTISGVYTNKIDVLTAWANLYNATATSGSATTSTSQFNAGTGNKRLLLVGFTANSATNGNAWSNINVTYGGTTVTPITTTAATGNRSLSWIGYLYDNQIPAGANNVVVTVTSANAITNLKMYAGSYQNVIQSAAPTGTQSSNTSVGTTTTAISSFAYGAFSQLMLMSNIQAAEASVTYNPTAYSTASGMLVSATAGSSVVANRSVPTATGSDATTQLTWASGARNSIVVVRMDPAKLDQATVTVSAPANATYGQTGLTATASGGSGTGAYSYSAGASTACSVNSSTGALTISSGTGTCIITATRAGDSTYETSAPSAPVTVNISQATQATLSVTGPASVTYGSTGTLNSSGGSGSGAVTYSVGSSTGCNITGGTTLNVSDVSGSCTVTATKAADTNYLAANSLGFSVTLNKANSSVTLWPTATAITLGQALSDSTLSGGSASPTGSFAFTDPSTVPSSSGTFSAPVTYTPTDTINYNTSTGSVNVTVNSAKIDQTITFGPLSPVTYGVADFGPGATASSSLTVTYTSSDTSVATIVGGLIHIVGAGTTTIYADQAGDASYNPAPQISQFLTANKTTLTVAAQNESRPYGAANPTFTPAYSGFVYGETSAVLTGAPSLTTSADSNSPVGSYDITASVGTLTAANYDFSYGTGTLAVSLASQTITFNPLDARTYGDATFDLSATGGASGNPVTYASSDLTVATVSGATVTIVGQGTTTITASQAGNSNYASATAQQNLVVNKKTLNVAAQNESRPYNTDNPGFTPIYTGFAYGDTTAVLTGTPAITTTATKTSPVGSYDIDVAVGSLSAANYSFSFTKGTLAVGLASQTISFAALPAKNYGEPAFELSATGGDSGNPVTFASSNAAVATVSGTTVTIVGAGTTTITASQAGNSNYASATATQDQLVNKAALTVTALAASRAYGASNPIFTPDYSGFAYSDTASVLQGSPSLTTDAVIDSPVGPYQITVAQGNLFSNNYSFSFVAGTMTINKANPAVTTWPTAGNISYGKSLAMSLLSGGVATPTGSFAFTMPSTTPPVGTAAQSVTFTPGDTSNYNTATGSANVTVDKANQTIGTITFTPSTLSVGGTVTASATASSLLAVSFSSDTLATCTVSGNTVNGVSAGTCTIRATQAGDGSYNAAPEKTQSIEVTSTSSTVTVTMAGTGSGTVNSSSVPDSLDGITCPGDCTGTYSGGTEVTLYAAPDWKSDFVSWFPACTGGSGSSCIFTPNGSAGITATFNFKQSVMMPGPVYYATVQDAYDASTDGILKLRDQTFSEDLVLNRTVSVTLDGGHGAAWSKVGSSVIHGSIVIVAGTVTISDIVVQ